MESNRIQTPGILLVIVSLVIFAVCGRADAGGGKSLSVSAAISLKDALTDLNKLYARKAPGVDVRFNLGSSGQLQRQIEEGAPVDLFISAGKKQMDGLAAKGMIVPATRVDLLGNEIILIVAKEKQGVIKGFADLSKRGITLAIGHPDIVPAGKYGKEALLSLKLWEKLADRIVFAKDARQVLTYVDSGNVDAGIVYRSDLGILQSATMAAAAPKGSHSPIVYPAAVVKGTKNSEAAKKYLAFLRSPEAAGVFAKYRFIPLAANR